MLAGSAIAAVDFPADEAGISAYVKAKDSIDLELAKSSFASIERETSDYIIGTVALSLHSEEQYPHVYVSNDGWIVAYYPDNRPSSWILPWDYYSGGPLSTTTLNETIKIVAIAIEATAHSPKYYDFRYPNASKIMVIVESTSSSNFFNVTIPTSFSTYAVDWSHNANTYSTGGGSGVSYAYLDDGTYFSGIGCCGTFVKYGFFGGQFNNGDEHTLEITASRSNYGRIGLVIEYAE